MIHKYALKGHYIVLDVNSGAVHLVDEIAYALLDHLSAPLSPELPEEVVDRLPFAEAEIRETYAELYRLYEAGQLFSADDYGVYADKMVLSPVKAMCLNVSHDCNLRCEYCFAGKGDYSQGRMVMSAETGKKAIDFLIAQSLDRQYLEVDFFGGEPLMNFDVVKEVLEYAREQGALHGKHFRFTITTNGMLLDADKITYINENMDNVVLSLDGRKSVTDRVRARVDGRGCYDTIVPKFQELVRQRGDKEYYARGTFTKYNKDFAEDVEAIAALGFDQVSVEPVVAAPGEPYALTEADLPEIFDEYERLADRLIERERDGRFVNFFHFMLDLNQGPCAIKRLRGCGCGNEYVAITPDGDIYPCHQFIGHEEWKMGSLYDGTFDLAAKERFSKATVYNKEDCRSCWAKFYCSGGCNANNMQYEGDILKPLKLSCELEKKRLECAIAIKAEMAAQPQ
ncbi:thioether cross-link-forming SCIFF peptide maturase [Ruminococcaceae bacterium OttesenSCG-928-L11]|nr:thioether cross-link-forming SCIFF peptide maturase [Ruminococcaceae bacterium OttesenSCG-928-L11]